MLRALAQDYDFLQVIEDPQTLTPDQEKEINRRLEFINRNPSAGKTWAEFEKDLAISGAKKAPVDILLLK
jgi:hypothetical protein